MNEDFAITTRTYDFILWAIPKINKFPRDHRFTLGERMCGVLYDLLEDQIEARYDPSRRSEILIAVNRKIDCLRFQFRLAKDFRILNLDGYEYAAKGLDEIGKMAGSWMKRISVGRE